MKKKISTWVRDIFTTLLFFQILGCGSISLDDLTNISESLGVVDTIQTETGNNNNSLIEIPNIVDIDESINNPDFPLDKPSSDTTPVDTVIPAASLTQEDFLVGLPEGTKQLKITCDRMTALGVKNKITEVFCGTSPPSITSIKELQKVMGFDLDQIVVGRRNGNIPNGSLLSQQEPFDPVGSNLQAALDLMQHNGKNSFALRSVSNGLGMKSTNILAPRVIMITNPYELKNINGRIERYEDARSLVAMGFTRGEMQLEIISGHFDPNEPLNFFERDTGNSSQSAWFRAMPEETLNIQTRNQDLRFYLFKFKHACTLDDSCNNGILFTEDFEKNWVEWTLYDEEDLKNTIADCRQCHQPNGPNAPKTLMNFGTSWSWEHYLGQQDKFSRSLVEDFLSAHGTDAEYAGIPTRIIHFGDGSHIQILLRKHKHSTDNTHNPNIRSYDSVGIMIQVENSTPSQPYDNTVSGYSPIWERLYERSVQGELIQIPYHDSKLTDPQSLSEATRAFRDYKAGRITELPNILDIFKKEDQDVRNMGFKVKAGLDGAGILTQACTQCHNSKLDQTISRARFNVDLESMSIAELMIAQKRIMLPEESLQVMPPSIFRILDTDEKERLYDYLQSVINQKSANN